MPRLIVSVRNAAEAALARSMGVDLIDVKEPLRGALGPADIETLEEIATLLSGDLPVSAALGELTGAQRLPATFSGRIQYAKIGLAGSLATGDWLNRWREEIGCLPRGVAAVAVVYADWRTAAAPPPEVVLEHAVALGCRAALLDTYDKKRGGLFDHLTQSEVSRFVAAARRRALACVLAGSLHSQAIAHALALNPDYIAVRGAVCDRERTGALDGVRVAQLVSMVQDSHQQAIV